MRPAEMALDETTSIDTVLHAINTLESLGDKYDVMILLQPTSPLREVSDIDNSYLKTNLSTTVGAFSSTDVVSCYSSNTICTYEGRIVDTNNVLNVKNLKKLKAKKLEIFSVGRGYIE